MQDHQIYVINSKALKRSIHCGVADTEIGGPHLGRNEYLFASDDAFINCSLKPFSDRCLIAIDPGRIDQTEPCFQCPVSGIFSLTV